MTKQARAAVYPRPFAKLLVALLVLLPIATAPAHAVILAQHAGSASPVLSGWTSTGGLNDFAGSFYEYGGEGVVELEDLSSASGSTRGYQYPPSSEETALGQTYGWQLTARINLPEDGDAVGASVYAEYANQTRRYGFSFGVESATGDPIFRTTEGQQRVVEAGRGLFHDYAFRYDPASNQTEVLIDGAVTLADSAGGSFSQPRCVWGGYSSADTGLGRYSRIQLEIFPPLETYLEERYPLDGDATELLSSSTNNNLGATPVPDRNGNADSALSFAPDGARAVLNNSSFQPGDRFTLAAWIRPAPHQPGDRRPILSKWNGSHAGSQSGAITLETVAERDSALTRLRFVIIDENDRIRSVVSDKPLRIDAWNHVAARVVNGHMALFIDGRLAGEASMGAHQIVETAYLWGIGCDGSGEPSSERRFRGAIDEAQFFSAALSDSEIAEVVSQRGLRLVGSSVEDGAQEVSLDGPIYLAFDGPHDVTTLNADALSLVGSISGPVAANLASATANSIEVQPATPFAAGEIVRLQLHESLRSESGLRSLPHTIEFQTTRPAQEELYARQTGSRALSQLGLLVDGAVGAFSQELDLMTVESIRPINLKLRYNSLLDRELSHLGYAWTHPFLARMEKRNDGSIVVYFDSSRRNVFHETSDPGLYRSLDLEAAYDTLNQQAFSGFFEPDNWVLRRKNGSIYIFGPRGNLLALGNRQRQFTVAEYEATRLVGIHDQASDRSIRFDYDSSSGLLSSVHDVGSSSSVPFRHVFFRYDAHHRLTSVAEPVIANELELPSSFSAQAIPDNDPEGLAIEIEVEREEPIGIASVDYLGFTHPRTEDLEFVLESPSGTRATILNRPAGQLPNFLSDIRLFAFEGENPQGTWILRVYDHAAGEFGTVSSFTLHLSGPSNPIALAYSEPNLSPAGSSKLTSATDALGGRLFAVEYDSKGRVSAQDDGRDDTPESTFAYDHSNPAQLKVTYTDRSGAKWRLAHDQHLQLLSSENPLGGKATWSYDANGLCIRTTDALGRQTSFSYDEDGLLASATDPTGAVTEFSHISGSPSLIRDSEENETSLLFSSDSLTNVTDALGHQTKRSYSGDGELQKVTMPDGSGVDYTWSNGLLRSAKNSQIAGLESSLAYDPAGRPLQITDGEGHTTEVRYRPNGEIIQRIDPLGNETNKRYDHRSRLIEQENKKGFSVIYEYDGNDNLVRATDPTGRERLFEYDAEDRMVREVSFEGLETRYEYDDAGLLSAVTSPTGIVQRYEYDAVGNRTATIDHDGVTVERVSYNRRDQPVSVTDAHGNTLSIEYDSLGRETAMVDAKGRRTSFAYDELDRLVSVTDPSGRTFTQTYHSDDLPKDITQPNGDAVTLGYDEANRPSGEDAYFYSTTADRFDGRDLLIVDELPGGAEIRYEYDELGRVSRITEHPDGDLNNIDRTVFFSYDANDNVAFVTANDPDADPVSRSTSRTFDDLDRITSYTDENGSSIGYAYHPTGSLRRLTYPDGKTVEYSYDQYNRLVKTTDWANRETTFAYNDLNRVESIFFPNGSYRLMDYDEAGRIVHRADFAQDDSIIVEYSYTYDERRNLMIEAAGHDVPGYQPEAVSMAYLRGDRLDSFNGLDVQIDIAGNMTQGPIDGQLASFSHDIRGRLLQAGDLTCHYSPEDRLSGWEQNGQGVTFVTNPAVSVTQILVKRNPDATNTRYVYGIGLLYEDGPEGLRVYHYDERGSAIAYSDGGGAVVGRVAYGPYGEVYHEEGWTDSIFKFHGLYGVITGPQGLNYMRFRWYSPEIKRFTSLDAHFGNIANIGSLNRYAFAGGNPANRIDPSGEFFQVVVGALVGATVSVAVEFIIDIADDGKINTDPADYAAAAIGGAITGGIIAACPVCAVAANVAGAAATNLIAAGLKGEAVDGYSLAADVIVAGAFGKLGQGGKIGSKGGSRFGRAVGKKKLVAEFFTPSSSTLGRSIAPKRVSTVITALRRATPPPRRAFKAFGVDIVSGLFQEAFSSGAEAAFRFTGENITDIFFDPNVLLINYYQASSGNVATGNLDARNRARYEQGQGNLTTYGEFNHWRLYRGFLELAQEPVPLEIERQLHAF